MPPASNEKYNARTRD